ncbi:hypothetical protein P170DRAFT_506100 [Aspergillus steynii IBT 23096]|uniref:Zinc finger PHD-type domain-containing protein n=1 Tax=Aspergillus steynii IBT 23096 TaxID=1392250 RepID=A0A2I2GRL4_9EURO|nr:uncharacterized protein P170DRAFT_506100 [Aspergillus steynii IBT 23096]PLB55518.1 hypothetical protein P170DRAFT_506100 [Aspergillus steynii IBT 23096]
MTATPSRSSRPKRRRASPQNTPASTRRKRARGPVDNQTTTEPNENSSTTNANDNDLSAQQNEIQPDIPQPPSGGGLVEPISAILARYKAWRKAGAPHDLRCFECHQETGLLEACETCRRVYHEACKPAEGCFASSPQQQQEEALPPRQWYCPVCVHLGWHVTPPVLTPPQSPVLTPALESGIPGREGSIHADTMQDASSARQSNSGSREVEASVEKEKEKEKEKHTDASRRRSRFDTLSPQVESALWVLYRELESVPLSQRRIANLENEMAQLRQEVRIQKNEIELGRASGSQVRSLQEEVRRLKAELEGRQTSVEELEALKTRNRELEGDVERSRDEVAESARTLAEWKKKLSSLIGDS